MTTPTHVNTPDLTRVPRVLVLRLSDECAWASEPWASDGPGSLAAGIRRAWAVRIEERRPGAGHPSLALRHRLTEIEHWIQERRARSDATDDARRSWEAQAATWRHRAAVDYGDRSTLRLQVQYRPDEWLGPTRGGTAASGIYYYAGPSGPLVPATITTAEVVRRELWEACRGAWAHAESLTRFCDGLGEWAMQLAPTTLTIVPPEEE